MKNRGSRTKTRLWVDLADFRTTARETEGERGRYRWTERETWIAASVRESGSVNESATDAGNHG